MAESLRLKKDVDVRCRRRFTAVVSYDPREVICSFLSPEAQCTISTLCVDLREDEGRLLEEHCKRRAPLCLRLTRLALCINWWAVVVIDSTRSGGHLCELQVSDGVTPGGRVTLRPSRQTARSCHDVASYPLYTRTVAGRFPTVLIESGEQPVERLEDGFLDGSYFTSIDLSGLHSLIECGAYFLQQTKKLRTVDLSALTALTSCGNTFLSNSSISNINLSGLRNLNECCGGFLSVTDQLHTVDMSAMTALTSCGNYFLSASSISSIDLSGLHNLVVCGAYFLELTNKLRTVNMSALTALTSCGNAFLSNSSISNINLSGLRNLVRCGDWFLSHTIHLRTVNMSALTALTSGGHCMLSASSIASITLSGFHKSCDTVWPSVVEELGDRVTIKYV